MSSENPWRVEYIKLVTEIDVLRAEIAQLKAALNQERIWKEDRAVSNKKLRVELRKFKEQADKR